MGSYEHRTSGFCGSGDFHESENFKQEADSEDASSETTSNCTSSSGTSSDSEDDCPAGIRNSSDNNNAEKAFANYIGSSNLVDLFETLLQTLLHDGELVGKEQNLSEHLAKTFGVKLPIQNQIEVMKQTNSQLRQRVMRLQNENKEIKTRLDCFEDPVFKLDALRAKLRFEDYNLVPVSINRRKHRTDPVTPVPSSMSLATLPPPEPDAIRVNTFIDTENARMNTYVEPHSNQQYMDYIVKLNSIEFIHCFAEFNGVLYFVVADRQTRFISHLTSKSPEDTEVQFATLLKPEHCQNVILIDAQFSPDGSMLACFARSRKPGFKSRSAPPSQLFFFDLASSTFLPDVLDNVTVYAFASNGGLIYAVPETPSSPSLLNLHSFGIPQDDVILASFEDFPGWVLTKISVTSDNRNIVVILTNCDQSQILQVPLDQTVEEPGEVAPLVVVPPRACGSFSFIHAEGSLWYFVTRSFAPSGRIFSVNTAHSEASPWKYQTVVTSSASAVMEWAVCLLDKFVICYCESGLHSLVIAPHLPETGNFNEGDDEIEKIPLQPGTISSYFFSEESLSLIFQFISFLIPSQIYRLQLQVSPKKSPGQTRWKVELLHEIPIPDPNSLKLTQLSLAPNLRQQTPPNLILIQPEPRSEKVSGPQPSPLCLLVPVAKEASDQVAQFSPLYFAISEYFGGFVCLVRSSEERDGETASDDTIAAAQYLVAQGFASPETMFLYGSELPSAHLAAVTLNRRPELFAGMVMKSGHKNTKECVQGSSKKASIGEGYQVDISKMRNSTGGSPTSAVKLTQSLTKILEQRDLHILPQYSKFLTDLGYGSEDKADNLFLKVYDPEDVNSADFQVEQEADILAFIHRVINHGSES